MLAKHAHNVPCVHVGVDGLERQTAEVIGPVHIQLEFGATQPIFFRIKRAYFKAGGIVPDVVEAVLALRGLGGLGVQFLQQFA